MTQIEQIKDYIAKEIKKFPHKEGLQETNVVNAIVRNVLKKLESFINYLPDEQPSNAIYKQKYKEAFEMAKFIKKNADDEGTIYIGKFYLENIFPELKKTKDEQ